MKIDLHCHTIKAKSGDGGRDIDPASLAEALAGNQVGIAAITNHNLFDLSIFKQCVAEASAKGIDLWPGIELDIRGKSRVVGHVIVIADPCMRSSFLMSVMAWFNAHILMILFLIGISLPAHLSDKGSISS